MNKLKIPISYRLRQWIDFLLPLIFTFFAAMWLVQSMQTIILSGNIFSVMRLWFIGLPMHSTTALNLTAIFLVSYVFYRTFQLGHQRVVRALLFTTLGVFFYDLIWSICNITINGYGSYYIPFVSFVITFAYILLIHKQTRILTFKLKYIIPVAIIYIVSLTIFIYSGFFQQFALYECGLATDPHGWAWLFNKTVTLWMWLTIALY